MAVDDEAARALGFGTVLDHVERSVDRLFGTLVDPITVLDWSN